ncbi:hypothetical protein ACFL17_08235 [Pseudomonadota bacterium]
MDNLNYFTLARAVHVVGVVLWIGGVAFVTTVLIPSLREIDESKNRLEQFEKLELKFAFQARIVTLITGLSGFYMLHIMNAWNRYLYIQYWWVHLMTMIWFLFTVVLFILEPLFLHHWFHKKATTNSGQAFLWLQRLHRILLSASLLAVFAAVAGAHGLNFI